MKRLAARRGAIGVAVLCASLAFGATSAFANRTFDSKISPFNNPGSVGFDSNGNVWVSDSGQSNKPPGQEGIYKYNAYPSQTLLAAPNTYIPWQYYSLGLQLAVDQSSNEVFVTQSNGREVDIFDDSGKFLRSWTSINGGAGGAAGQGGIHVAVDNSNTYSRGRVYLSLATPEDDIEALDAAQRPVDFPATASYIAGSKLTGTPSGRFGEVQNVAVDANGNIYVNDAGKGMVDEFDSTGTFVRTFPGSGGIGVDPTNGNVLIATNGITEYDSSGNQLETINDGSGAAPSVNSQGYAYIPNGTVDIYTPTVIVPKATYGPVLDPTLTSGTLNATIDPNGGGNVTECKFEYGTAEGSYGLGSKPCEATPSLPYSAPTEVSAEVSGLTVETTYHYRVVVENTKGIKYGADQTYTPQHVLGLSTNAATGLTESEATLNGSFVGNGEDTNYYFEWGPTSAYGNKTAVPPGTDANSPSGPGRTPLSFDLSGLNPYSTYHYRIVASNGAGTAHGEDQMFTTPPGVPSGQDAAVTAVHADRAEFHAQVNPNGANTTVHFEYVDDADFQASGWANASRAPAADVGIGMSKNYQSASAFVDGLAAGTLYHYRVVGTNEAGSGTAGETFKTFGFIPSFTDPCPNAHARQQTGTSLLLDCRAYELVSAGNAGGYDVESNLVAGQTPFADYPTAESASGEPRVLYGVHDGGIPGTGNPTNRGVDPYVATRGPDGWSTEYAGIPANDPNATGGPFASTLAEADASLGTLAFGGSEICAPCFADGSAGTPIHLPNGELVQGMAGSIPQPTAKPAGFIAKDLSADGTHFVFGSISQFEPDGINGEISIYDRNLTTGVTHVVSKTPAGVTMTGAGIGELDISADGSHIVIGQLVSESEGAKYWHLYMNVGDSGQTIDLTPGTTSGVLYDGMSADGSKVFFTTKDALTTATNQDTDHSADIYEAEVSASGATLTRISTGTEGTGNSDTCDPAANTVHAHWNTTGSEADCGVVAVGGGGGVAAGDGTIYFLSPEQLDGSSNGVQNAPNLYVARPGQAPHFVATLESSANAPLPEPEHPFLRSFGQFSNPAGVAIDDANGDVYGLDIGTDEGAGSVQKFDSSGHAVPTYAGTGKLTVTGVIGFYSIPCGIAVDNDPASPNHGDLYVPDLQDGIIKKFGPEGAHLGDISSGGRPTAVAVDPANGDVYVTAQYGGVSVYDTEGNPITSFPTISAPTGVAVDSNGNVYVVNGGGESQAQGTTQIYSSSGTYKEQLDGNPSRGVTVDPSNNHVYVDEGNQVTEFNSSGQQVGNPIGVGLLGGSISLAADSGALDIANLSKANIASYGPAVVPVDPSTDNPLVVDSVSSAAARNTADFQVTPSGNDAVFTSTLPLTGYDNAAHHEVFRYDAPSETLDCASCNPTDEQATGEATLASNGLSISNDGRVFFNSTEGLVDRDLNGQTDVYEWEKGASADPQGTIQLISTGASPSGSSLLGISADATDAYFFTRDTLVSSDNNGNRVKLYDARAGGGYPQVPAPIPCQASDECHGPSSQVPPPPNIKTIAGTPVGNKAGSATKRCRAGLVKKRGKCVRTPRHAPKHHRKVHRHG